MAYRLKNRQLQIPGGYKFIQPETGWSGPRFASFNALVDAVVRHRAGNPRFGLTTDRDAVEMEVDAYNTQLCLSHGWKNYIIGGEADAPPPPQRRSGLPQKLGSVVAGAEVLVKWLASGAEAVAKEKAESRAAVCAECPLNSRGDLTAFFTRPVSNAIRAALNQRRDWSLSTSQDPKLGICQACLCPLKLKMHMPIENFAGIVTEEVKKDLVPNCWILEEIKALPR